ncbi:hypothetical protein [Streptomyces sp. NPDC015125]|uniref:hypothetical protein n=1 Tax=Streptomyces sp. NPDC015125 TaxID=3364938 RepID=UPI0036F50811
MPNHAVDLNRVSKILSGARMRTVATDFPELGALRMRAGLPEDRMQGRGRSTPYLTQQEVSLLLGFIDERQDWYKRLELGQIRQPAATDLRKVSRLLRLTPAEWDQLHIALFGRRTLSTNNPKAGLTVDPIWHRIIRSSNIAAYISNRSFDVLDFNPEADALFGGMPDNVLRHFLGRPHGRHPRSSQPQTPRPWGDKAMWQLKMLDLPPQPPNRCHMVDYQIWGLAATAGLRQGLADHPGDPTLREIEAEVREDRELLAMYEGPVHGDRTPSENEHPDGTRRLMYHPVVDEIGIMLGGVGGPGGAPGARVVWMEWSPLESATGVCPPSCAIYHIHGR